MFKDREVQQNWNQKERGGDFFFFLPTVGILSATTYSYVPSMHVEPNLKIISFFGKGSLWQHGLWSFQTGGTKLERFLPKNQHTQRKLLNF